MKNGIIALLTLIVLVSGATFLPPEDSRLSTIICICGSVIGTGLIIALAYRQVVLLYRGDTSAGIILLKGLLVWAFILGPPLYFIGTWGFKKWLLATVSSKMLYIFFGATGALLLNKYIPVKILRVAKQLLREIYAAIRFKKPEHPQN